MDDNAVMTVLLIAINSLFILTCAFFPTWSIRTLFRQELNAFPLRVFFIPVLAQGVLNW